MELESGNQVDQNKQPEAEVKTSEGRRRLIRGTLVGAPILLALKSTPVLASNCKLPSGFSTSGNLSRNGGATCTQPAHQPSYWPSHINPTDGKFTGTGLLKTTPFNSVFGPPSDPLNRNFLTVLNSGVNFASLVVAAFLDIKALYYVAGITTLNIQDMWKGNYKPPGSINNWTVAESENYLRYTMGLPLNP